MIRKIFLGFSCWIGMALALMAQDSLLLDANFQFKDGLYFTHTTLQANCPDIDGDSVYVEGFTNPQNFITQIAAFQFRGNKIDPKTVKYLVAGGIPFIRLDDSVSQRTLTTFSALKVRGKLCFFAFPFTIDESFEMSAYNPKSGRPFRTGMVKRSRETVKEHLLWFPTGETSLYDKQNLLRWVQPVDAKLATAIENISAKELTEKLYKTLLIFDDRHQVYLPAKGCL